MRGRKQEAPRIPAERREEVEAVLHRPTLGPRVRERVEMVKARLLGQELPQIATWCGRTPRTVVRWLARFVEGGVAALGDAPRRGRPARADAAYRQALAAAVETAVPMAFGVVSGLAGAMAVAVLAVPRLDPMPTLAPPAIFVTPWAVVLYAMAVVPLWTSVIATVITRSTERGDPMRVLQGAP